MTLRRLAAVSVICLLMSAGANADARDAGNLFGVITDGQKPLPGVTVTLTGPGVSATQISNADGSIRFLGLSPGLYTITTSLDGFRPARFPNIRIVSGQKKEIALTLSAAPGASTVSVPYTIAGVTAGWSKSVAGGGDFGGALTGTLTFSGTAVSKTISIPVYGDGLAEGDETASITLGTVAGATVARATGTLSIHNDD